MMLRRKPCQPVALLNSRKGVGRLIEARAAAAPPNYRSRPMRAIAIIPLFLCAACATTPCPPPAISVRTVEVIKPVPVACVKPEQIPAMPPRVGDDLTGDAQRDLDVVAASAIRLRAALDQALALLGACQ